MAGFRNIDGGLNRFDVAHFADQNDIGILPQHILQGLTEGGGVGAYLSLIHNRFFVLMDKFDRVFDRHDVSLMMLI